MISIFDNNLELPGSVKTNFSKYYSALLKRKELGFLDLHDRNALLKSSIDRAQALDGKVDTLCIVGIGGSSLGVEVIWDAFKHKSKVDLVLFDNVDPFGYEAKINSIKDLSRAHWVIISKSGKTVETLANASFVDEHLKAKGLKLKDNSTVVTELKENPLYDWAIANSVPVLELPLDVGGRFSVLTPVGIFPACMMGLNVEEIFKGVRSVLEKPDTVIELATLFKQSLDQQKWITMLWVYSDRLYSLGLWWQQLWAESLAKAKTRDGGKPERVSTPIICRGAIDQHSLLQQVVEGDNDKLMVFLKNNEDLAYGPVLNDGEFSFSEMKGKTLGHLLHAELEGTMTSVKECGIPCAGLQVECLNEATLGALFMTFELLIGTYGEYLDIDAFDQPGVEAGKIITRQILTKGQG